MNYFQAPDASVLTASPKEGPAETECSALADLSVVHVVRQYAPMIGGLEDFVRQLVAQQKGRFASLKIVTLDRLFTDPGHCLPEKDVIDGVEVIRIPFRGSSRYPLAPGVFSRLSGADLIHVHAVDFFFDAIALAKPFHRRKLVATTHGGFFHTSRHLALKKVWLNTMTRLSANLYDGIACCSQNDLALFQEIAPGKVRLIENGVDLSKFKNASSAVPEKRLLTLGRFSANKRLDRTLDALAVLVRTDPAWRLDIVGSPSDLSADDLSNLIESRGLADHVDVHLGITDAEVRDVVSRCSLFVSASEYEGFGIAMIEALSAGLIPVVEPNTAFRSLKERHPMVHLADYSNPEAAAGTIDHAMAELEQAPSLRSAAIASSDQHSWQSTIRLYDGLYLDALGARG